jgi:glycine C-acetyltransferase
MTRDNKSGGGAIDLGKLIRDTRAARFDERIALAGPVLDDFIGGPDAYYLRVLASPNEREVEVYDRSTGQTRRMLMFAANSYLALTNHSLVRKRVLAAVDEYGVGIAGSAIVCGYSKLHLELEERLSALKHTEATLIFPTGYSANVGTWTGLTNPSDVILYDELSHTSTCDGIKLAGVESFRFLHNDVDDLRSLLTDEVAGREGDVFVGVEGVYSMDGDLAPLDRLVPACKEHGAILVVDDAHGTAVLGENGAGTAEHFGVSADVSITTFSKAFGVVGAAVSASRDIVSYLRYFANSYVFSTSLPPMVIAAVLGGLDALEQEPELRTRLRDNVNYTLQQLSRIGIDTRAPAGIIMINVPSDLDVRAAAKRFADAGIFVGVVAYPAVPLHQQRFRLGMTPAHTRQDIDRLIGCVEEIWSERE